MVILHEGRFFPFLLFCSVLSFYSGESDVHIYEESLESQNEDPLRDFSGGPVVKNSCCNAGDMGSSHSQGTKIPHAAEQLSPHVATTELVSQTRESVS